MRRRWSDRPSRRVRTLVTQLARSRLFRESGRMRADIHDGPEQTLQSEAGYSTARPHQPGRRNLLHRTAGPYSWVKSGKAQLEHMLSALTRKADIDRRLGNVRLVPIGDICSAAKEAIRSPRRRGSSARGDVSAEHHLLLQASWAGSWTVSSRAASTCCFHHSKVSGMTAPAGEHYQIGGERSY
jgi:hypothetical protein